MQTKQYKKARYNGPKPVGQPVRNIKAFVKSYLDSDSGKAALHRQPIRIKNPDGSFTNQWRSSAMAHAFKQAI